MEVFLNKMVLLGILWVNKIQSDKSISLFFNLSRK